MGASVFGSYIRSIKETIGRIGGCGRGSGKGTPACKLFKDKSSIKRVGDWEGENIPGSWDTWMTGYLSRMSRNICIMAELWITGLDLKYQGGSRVLGGTCSYPDFRQFMKQGGGGSQCEVQVQKSHWIQLMTTPELNMKQENQKELQLCMEIVKILMLTLQIKRKHSKLNVDSDSQQEICEKAYRELKDWGGEELALRIMSAWFITDDWPKAYKEELPLAGRDMFEIITEEIMGLDSGIKGLTCKYIGEQQKPGASGIVPVKTVCTEDVKGASKFVEKEWQTEELETRAGEQESILQQVNQGLNRKNNSEQGAPAHPGEPPRGAHMAGIIGGAILTLALTCLSVYGLIRIFRPRERRRLIPLWTRRSNGRIRYTAGRGG
ncbi:hypothetical protein C922_05148 [Plasmodium inui San Antonio 1]|uniref:Uncharacterized protein n=1 Tax=Plasmodium inui San Antonio 1 TaxID=1237626 RepID=W6ZYU4_9APIC|nr:hypothetical protein C922_05148 [Plasmodium inui San Antonio 1]EUD64460.1 hypothetical protein C922_05148 [Plasmodium inui San Antonio 1]